MVGNCLVTKHTNNFFVKIRSEVLEKIRDYRRAGRGDFNRQ